MREKLLQIQVKEKLYSASPRRRVLPIFMAPDYSKLKPVRKLT